LSRILFFVDSWTVKAAHQGHAPVHHPQELRKDSEKLEYFYKYEKTEKLIKERSRCY